MKEKMQKFEHDMNGPVSERQKMIKEMKHLQNRVEELNKEIRDREEKSQFQPIRLEKSYSVDQSEA